ncbi:MAG: 4Fe-4S binding protein [Planctomycetes bacterium]|jgi:NAD-dependent dihydropyrimidine dehydrogenase PreA subunit|nr:4Fe-4S binding protein [Planctomycetota bacterium]
MPEPKTDRASRKPASGTRRLPLAPGRFQKWRLGTQIASLVAINPYVHKLVPGLSDKLMGFCVPVMNCWSCPLAAFACPVGAVGQFLARGLVPFLSLGILVVTGVLVGRLLCGWACPFGLVQDLMFKIPSRWKLRTPQALRWVKYGLLVAMVIAIPLLFGVSGGADEASGYFYCKWCPAGTLEASIPVNVQMALDPEGKKGFGDMVLGYLGSVKFWIAIAFLGSFVVFYRPFCKVACPIGAFLGLFNPVSFLKIGQKRGNCRACMGCADDCPVIPDVVASDNPPECIRCYRCDAPPCEANQRRKAAEAASAPAAPGPATPPEGLRILRERCKGCGFCAEFCPRGVLEMKGGMNAKGYHTPKPVRAGECMDCRLCESVCPEFAIFRVGPGEATASAPAASAKPANESASDS